jgi:hypothetical protein
LLDNVFGAICAEARLATALLPNGSGCALLYGLRQCGVNAGDRVFLHSWQYVTIRIEGDADLAVPKALAGNLRMDAS